MFEQKKQSLTTILACSATYLKQVGMLLLITNLIDPEKEMIITCDDFSIYFHSAVEFS